MLKHIFCLFLIGIIGGQVAVALRTYDQTASNTYNADQYKVRLQIIQQQYRKQAQSLNAQLDYINDLIADKNITKRQKILKLSESMADQRDLIFEIEKLVNLPYELKQCQCIEISEEQKQELLKRISNLNQTINKLQSSYQDCSEQKCPKTQELKASTQNMKVYLTSLKQIVDSDCCQQPLYMAPEKASGLVDLNHTLKIDNLDKVWGYTDHSRFVDNQYYVQVTSKKEYRPFRFQLTTKYNTTNCPTSKPFVDFKNNTCFRCNLTCQKFDLMNRTCHSCDGKIVADECKVDQGEYFDKQSNTCKKCQQNQQYSAYYHKCKECAKNQFIGESHKCQDCLNNMYYDSLTKKCVHCPGRRIFSVAQNKCVRCPENTELNMTTFECQPCKQGEFYNSTIGICSFCKQGSVYNSTSKQCSHKTCPADYPHYNDILGVCEQCPLGTVFVKQINRCINSNKIGICDPQMPHYNYFTHKCEKCPQGTVYNKYFLECEAITK